MIPQLDSTGMDGPYAETVGVESGLVLLGCQGLGMLTPPERFGPIGLGFYLCGEFIEKGPYRLDATVFDRRDGRVGDH